MKFCTKCGTKLQSGSSVCPNCGYDSVSHRYIKLDDGTESGQSLNNSDGTEAGNDAEDDSIDDTSIIDSREISNSIGDLRKKKIVFWSAVAIVLICTFVFAGKFMSSPGRTVAAFENAVNKNDPGDLSRVMYTYDGRIKMTSDAVKPLIQSFKTTPSEFTDIINNLNNQVLNLKNGGAENRTNSLYITEAGRTMFFFPKYKIAFNPVFLTITSSVKGADILVNDEKVAQADSGSFSKQFGPYVPGIYKVEGRASGAFGKMDKSTNVDFIKSKKQKAAVSALKGIYLDVNSDYTNNEVYIDGKDTGRSVNSGDKMGPVASGASIYAIVNYNGEQVKSSVFNLSDNDTAVYFDYSGSGGDPEQHKNDINNMITGYASSLANALTYGDVSALVEYMYPGSKIYKQQMNNINSYYKGNNNFYEQYDSAVVNSYKMNPDGKSGVVDATEIYDINDHYSEGDSQASTRTFENVYKFKYNDTAKTYQLIERTSAVEK